MTQTQPQTQPAQPQLPAQSTEPTPTVPSTTPPGMVPPSGLPTNVPNTTKVDDQKFLQRAALEGATEVELGKLALRNSSSDSVKQFGQKMIDAHTQLNDRIRELASAEKFDLAATLDNKDNKTSQRRIANLTKLSGKAFDQAYIKDQEKAHKLAIDQFQAESQNGSHANVMAFAGVTLPSVKQHLGMLKELEKEQKSRH